MKEHIKRKLKALELRRQGLTFKEVGKHFNVGRERARQMVYFAECVEKYRPKDNPITRAIIARKSILATCDLI